jgi:antitoxin CptB
MDRTELERLKWKCRRGLLELDIVLERYLRAGDLHPQLSEFLDLQDNDLWDIVAGRSDDYPPQFKDVVAQLRAA